MYVSYGCHSHGGSAGFSGSHLSLEGGKSRFELAVILEFLAHNYLSFTIDQSDLKDEVIVGGIKPRHQAQALIVHVEYNVACLSDTAIIEPVFKCPIQFFLFYVTWQ